MIFPEKIEVESRNNLANAYFLLQEPNNDEAALPSPKP
jgi:hypothetical protein